MVTTKAKILFVKWKRWSRAVSGFLLISAKTGFTQDCRRLDSRVHAYKIQNVSSFGIWYLQVRTFYKDVDIFFINICWMFITVKWSQYHHHVFQVHIVLPQNKYVDASIIWYVCFVRYWYTFVLFFFVFFYHRSG